MSLQRWAIPSFTIDTDTELMEAASGMETVIFSLLLSNYETADQATFDIRHTDTDGTTDIFKWTLEKAAGGSPTAVQAPIVLMPGDKIFVKSDKANVAIVANGEAK